MRAAAEPAFRLLLITPPTTSAAELALLPGLFAAGLQTLHLRKPGASAAEVEAYLRAVPAAFHPRIVLHAHHALAARFPLKGLHLPAAARADWRASNRHAGLSLSTSLHSLAELRQHRRRYDYVLLSPIFNSLSKPGYGQAFDLAALQATLGQLQRRTHYAPRVLALGGIEAANLPLVRAAGFAGAAVLGAVWQAPDPVAAFRQLQAVYGYEGEIRPAPAKAVTLPE
jgi:thiamine-phosphate pyrophosphorylase